MRNDELERVCEAYLKLAMSKDHGKYGRLVLGLLSVIIENDPKLIYLQTLMSTTDDTATLQKAKRNLAVNDGMPADLYDVIRRVSD